MTVEGFYPATETNVTVDVYAFNTAATEFASKDGKLQWFGYLDAPYVGHAAVDFTAIGLDELGGYGDVPVTVEFDTPIEYEGESLVLTWVMHCDAPENFAWGELTGFYSFSTDSGKHTGVVSGVDAVSGNLAGSTNEMAYLEIDYTPITYTGGEQKPFLTVENITPGVKKYTNDKGETSNYVSIEFTVGDATALEAYTVKYNGKGSGLAMTGTKATLDFVPVLNNKADAFTDVFFTVEADGYLTASATVAAADIAALFPAPVTVSTCDEAVITGSYDVQRASNVSVTAATSIQMTSAVPVAKAAFDGATLLTSSDNNDLLAALCPAAAKEWASASDFETVDGVFGVTSTAKFNIPVKHCQPYVEGWNQNWTFTPKFKLPICSSTTPTLNGATPATATVSNYETTSERVKVSLTDQAIFDITVAEDTHRKLTVVRDDPEYLVIIAGHEHTVNYYVYNPDATPEAPAVNGIMMLAEEEDSEFDNVPWNATGKTVVALPIDPIKGKAIKIATFDANNNMKEKDHLYIASDGNISGVEDITADTTSAVYYNLQGVRVANPAGGLYIRCQGNTATKVYVK